MIQTGEILQNIALKVLEAETSRIETAVYPSAEGKREADRDSVSLECPTCTVTMTAVLPSQFWMVNSPKHTPPPADLPPSLLAAPDSAPTAIFTPALQHSDWLSGHCSESPSPPPEALTSLCQGTQKSPHLLIAPAQTPLPNLRLLYTMVKSTNV